MEEPRKIRLEGMAKIMKALAHPTRLFITEELSQGEKCVCELTEMIGVDTSTVSKHLSVLKNSGIVKASKKGLMVFYSLKCPCVLNFYSCVEQVISSDIEHKQSMLS